MVIQAVDLEKWEAEQRAKFGRRHAEQQVQEDLGRDAARVFEGTTTGSGVFAAKPAGSVLYTQPFITKHTRGFLALKGPVTSVESKVQTASLVKVSAPVRSLHGGVRYHTRVLGHSNEWKQLRPFSTVRRGNNYLALFNVPRAVAVRAYITVRRDMTTELDYELNVGTR